MTARRECPIAEVDMPQAFILLYGAALAAPLVLFGILIWSGLEQRLELGAKERLVRSRIMQPRVAPAASLVLIPVAAPAVISPRRRDRSAA